MFHGRVRLLSAVKGGFSITICRRRKCRAPYVFTRIKRSGSSPAKCYESTWRPDVAPDRAACRSCCNQFTQRTYKTDGEGYLKVARGPNLQEDSYSSSARVSGRRPVESTATPKGAAAREDVSYRWVLQRPLAGRSDPWLWPRLRLIPSPALQNSTRHAARDYGKIEVHCCACKSYGCGLCLEPAQ